VPPQQYTVHFTGGLYVDRNFFPYSGYVVRCPAANSFERQIECLRELAEVRVLTRR
jgi:hypothetical protein